MQERGYCGMSAGGIKVIVLLLFRAEASDCVKNTSFVPSVLLHVSTDPKCRMSS